jgi:prenyltransferase beta subunit
LDNVVEQNDAEELAEFILSISASNNSALSDDENAIPDQILDVLSGLGFDIHDYEGSSEINSTHYLKNSVSSGYDYLAYSENIISELYCS